MERRSTRETLPHCVERSLLTRLHGRSKLVQKWLGADDTLQQDSEPEHCGFLEDGRKVACSGRAVLFKIFPRRCNASLRLWPIRECWMTNCSPGAPLQPRPVDRRDDTDHTLRAVRISTADTLASIPALLQNIFPST